MYVEKLHVEQHSLFGFVISICVFTTLFNYLYTFFCYKHVNLLRMNDTRNVQVITDSFGVITKKANRGIIPNTSITEPVSTHEENGSSFLFYLKGGGTNLVHHM